MVRITQTDFPDLSCEFRAEKLSQELNNLSQVLETPIEKFGVWISFDGGTAFHSEEKKYADYYPLFGLFIKEPDADDRRFIPVKGLVSESTWDKLCSDNFSDMLDALLEASSEEDNEKTRVTEIIIRDNLSELIHKSVLPTLPPHTKVYSSDFNKELTKHCYKILSSAKYHQFSGQLTALRDSHQNLSPSYLRQSQLRFLIGRDIPSGLKENYAVDYGNFILYLHMDNSNGGYDIIHFNKYQYNQYPDILPFVDANNGYILIPYSDWQQHLGNKPILVFGYDEQMRAEGLNVIPNYPLHEREPLLKFWGYHNSSVTADYEGNYQLSLLKTCNFPVDS